jgi:hypothetical protein
MLVVVGMMTEFVIFAALLLLLFAGFRWIAFLFASFLFVAGALNLVRSIDDSPNEGAQVVLSLIEFIGAAALCLSQSIRTYQRDRREKGIPWLNLGLAGVGFFTCFVVIFGISMFQAISLKRVSREQAVYAGTILRSFAESFDMSEMNKVAKSQEMASVNESAYIDQAEDQKREAGPLQKFQGPRGETLREVCFNPSVHTIRQFNAFAEYQNENIFYYLAMDCSRKPWTVTQFSWRVTKRTTFQPQPAAEPETAVKQLKRK